VRDVWNKPPGGGPAERSFSCTWDCCEEPGSVVADASPMGGDDKEGADPSET
jgi:hypothetical protein